MPLFISLSARRSARVDVAALATFSLLGTIPLWSTDDLLMSAYGGKLVLPELAFSDYSTNQSNTFVPSLIYTCDKGNTDHLLANANYMDTFLV